MKTLFILFGWLVIRPIRWSFCRMLVASSGPRWWFKRAEFGDYIMWPNLHWWLLYRTVFKFFKWLNLRAWRHLCKWENGFLSSKPLVARLIHRIGATTAGYAISGGQCFHCGSVVGDPVLLSQDTKYFELLKAWTESTQDGTDHIIFGNTTCPKCGYVSQYKDGSL